MKNVSIKHALYKLTNCQNLRMVAISLESWGPAEGEGLWIVVGILREQGDDVVGGGVLEVAGWAHDSVVEYNYIL